PHRDPKAGAKIHLGARLYDPARGGKRSIDLRARVVFGMKNGGSPVVVGPRLLRDIFRFPEINRSPRKRRGKVPLLGVGTAKACNYWILLSKCCLCGASAKIRRP